MMTIDMIMSAFNWIGILVFVLGSEVIMNAEEE